MITYCRAVLVAIILHMMHDDARHYKLRPEKTHSRWQLSTIPAFQALHRPGIASIFQQQLLVLGGLLVVYQQVVRADVQYAELVFAIFNRREVIHAIMVGITFTACLRTTLRTYMNRRMLIRCTPCPW